MKYSHLTPSKCKSIRLCLRWTQKQLAKAANCSSSTVSSFENDKVTGFNTVLALEEALTETGKVKIYSDGFEFKVKTHLTPRKCRLIRLCLGWSRKQLAKAANCSLSTVSSFENYEIIGFDMLLDLEEALIKTGKVKIYSRSFEFKEGY